MRIVVLIFVAMYGCGPDIPEYIDPQLLPYVIDYLTECQAHEACKSRPINKLMALVLSTDMKVNGDDIVGDCNLRYLGVFGTSYQYKTKGYIRVVPQAHLESSIRYRALLYHELGHCLHNLRHDETSPIMREYLPGTGFLIQYWDYSIDQMFDRQMNEK